MNITTQQIAKDAAAYITCLNEQRPDVGRYSAFMVIDFPQCGQVIAPSFGGANNSGTGTPRAAAIFSSVPIVGLPCND